MRYAKRTDDNHAAVRDRLRELVPGATVRDLSGAGAGIPDLLVGYAGQNFLFEIKDGSKSPSKRKLTRAQVKFFDE